MPSFKQHFYLARADSLFSLFEQPSDERIVSQFKWVGLENSSSINATAVDAKESSEQLNFLGLSQRLY
ncbi:MAG: hypothetical protein EOP09_09525 [Proteobacteria bacterium]|nr:MAG: hypothetical protein EOP09_09525 [Pseudomonadota bacterium]